MYYMFFLFTYVSHEYSKIVWETLTHQSCSLSMIPPCYWCITQASINQKWSQFYLLVSFIMNVAWCILLSWCIAKWKIRKLVWGFKLISHDISTSPIEKVLKCYNDYWKAFYKDFVFLSKSNLALFVKCYIIQIET